MQKGELRKLLKQEQKVLELVSHYDFEVNEVGDDTLLDELYEAKDKLKKVKSKIITAMRKDLEIRTKSKGTV